MRKPVASKHLFFGKPFKIAIGSQEKPSRSEVHKKAGIVTKLKEILAQK
jgi:hypothetical protein